jgi:hypothetical protein
MFLKGNHEIYCKILRVCFVGPGVISSFLPKKNYPVKIAKSINHPLQVHEQIKLIVLPKDSIILDGTASSDPVDLSFLRP